MTPTVTDAPAEAQSNMDDQTPSAGDQLCVNPDKLAALLEHWKKLGYHVLSPTIRVMAFAPGYGVNVCKVQLSPNAEDGDVYFDKTCMNENERAPSKIGLQKISSAAGVSWVPSMSIRTDDRRIPNLWEFRAVGVILQFDGAPQTVQGTAEVDLRDESAQIGGWSKADWRALMASNSKRTHINGWSEARVMQARRFGLRLAETKAMSAAIRTLGLKQKYTQAEFGKPFIVLRVAYVPDLSDPEIRRMTADRFLSGSALLYPGAHVPRAALPEAQSHETIEPPTRPPERVPVAVHAASQAPQAPIAAQAPPATAAPADPRHEALGDRIADIKVLKAGTNRRGAWKLWQITLSNGATLRTFDSEVAGIAQDCLTERALVEVWTDKDGEYEMLTEIKRLDAPTLELTADDIRF